ncbi:MAG: hypothetical protein U0169_10970 [Polyangiaceae bacterium]
MTLDPREGLRREALARMIGDPRIDLGESVGAHVPVVLDTQTASEGAELCESLLATPGVLGLDVVRIDFAADEEA